jgi:hypothetical protein
MGKRSVILSAALLGLASIMSVKAQTEVPTTNLTEIPPKVIAEAMVGELGFPVPLHEQWA